MAETIRLSLGSWLKFNNFFYGEKTPKNEKSPQTRRGTLPNGLIWLRPIALRERSAPPNSRQRASKKTRENEGNLPGKEDARA